MNKKTQVAQTKPRNSSGQFASNKSIATPVSGTKAVFDKARKAEPKNISQLVKAIESDASFLLGYSAIASKVEQCEISIEVKSDDPKASKLAKNLEGVWKKSIHHMMRSFAYGRAAFEKVFKVEDNDLVLLSDLDYLPYEITEIQWNEGCFDGLKVKGGGQEVSLEPRDSFNLSLDSTPLEPWGKSRYLGAPQKVLKAKQELEGLTKNYLAKYALGILIGTAPEPEEKGAFRKGDIGEIGNDGMPIDKLGIMATTLDSILSGGSLALPSKCYANGKPFWDVRFLESTSKGEPLQAVSDQLDKQALHSLGIPELTLAQGSGTGSYGAASVQAESFQNLVAQILNQFKAAFQKYVIEKLIDENYWTERPSLQIVFHDVDKALVVDIARTLMATNTPSVFATQGALDVERLFQIAKLPIGSGIKQAIETIKELPLQGIPVAVPTETPVEDSEPVTSEPSPVAEAPEVPPIAPTENVAATALNGAQIASLLEITGQVVGGLLPVDAAKAIVGASFPFLDTATIEAILGSLESFKPREAEPAPVAASLELAVDPPKETQRFPFDDVADYGLNKSKEIWAKLPSILETPKLDEKALEDFFAELREARANTILYGKAEGLKNVGEKAPVKEKALSQTRQLGLFSWTPIQQAIDWLIGQDIVLPSDAKNLITESAKVAAEASGDIEEWLKQKIKDSIVESIANAEHPRDWKARVSQIVDLSNSEEEKLQRTYSHSAYIEGQEQALDTPRLKEAFPFFEYLATRDTRVRPEHLAMDGKVYSRKSNLYDKAKDLLGEWNCRCSQNPITESEAKAKGITEE